MSNDGLSIEYENGVADVLAYLAGPEATVDRDVYFDGLNSKVRRQIDIAVRTKMFGATEGLLVVDCKRWQHKVDVADAQSFEGLVRDVGADAGFLITTAGASVAAREILRHSGLRTDVLSLDELSRWRPAGTWSVTIQVASEDAGNGATVLRRAGFRVRVEPTFEDGGRTVSVEGYRHYPTHSEEGLEISDVIVSALNDAGIDFEVVGTGVVASGGTPNHKWMPVTANGTETGQKVLAADEIELANELQAVRSMYESWGFDMDEVVLDVRRPDGWPYPKRLIG